jgi:hypothetical protein
MSFKSTPVIQELFKWFNSSDPDKHSNKTWAKIAFNTPSKIHPYKHQRPPLPQPPLPQVIWTI